LKLVFKDRLPIDEVTIGPTLKPDYSQQSLKILLSKTGYSPLTIVKRSAVPFRG
jgi:hypothetical protein